MGVSPLVGALVVGAVVNAGLAVVGYRRREVTAATPFVFLTVGIALWTGLDAVQYAVTSPGLVSLFTRVSYAGNLLTTYATFVLVVVYTGHGTWLTRRVLAVLTALPIALYALALTTPAHGLMWSDRAIVLTDPVTVSTATYGPAFYAHLAISYAMVTVVLGLLVQTVVTAHGRQRQQAALILTATLIPVAGSLPWLFGVAPIHPSFDLTPFSFILTGVLLYVALFWYGFLDLAPVARHALVETMHDPVVAVDGRGRIADVNPAAAALLQRLADTDSVLGEPAAGLVPGYAELVAVHSGGGDDSRNGGDGDATAAGDPAADRAGRGDHRTDATVTTGGEVRHFDVRASPLTDARDEYIGSLLILRDVTDRRENERRLAESERRNRTIVDNLPDGLVALFDADLRYVRVGGGAIDEIEYTSADFEGSTISEIHTEGYVERFLGHYRAVFDGERSEFEFSHGGRRWRTYLVPVTDDDGAVSSGIGFTMDVTELRARERELERKNERLETFTGVVSHDLRNPLSVIDGYVDLARETGDDEYFDGIETAVDRMDRLIDDLLELARRGDTIEATDPVDLADTVRMAWQHVDTADATLRIGDDFGDDLGNDLGVVEADRDRLTELLENLFRNAVEHGGDDVTVTVGPLEPSEPLEPDGADAAERRGFFVADDGPGVPAVDRERVFEHGYTTNDGGTGFGLNIVEQVADAHGWSVSLAESDEGGARFAFTWD